MIFGFALPRETHKAPVNFEIALLPPENSERVGKWSFFCRVGQIGQGQRVNQFFLLYGLQLRRPLDLGPIATASQAGTAKEYTAGQ